MTCERVFPQTPHTKPKNALRGAQTKVRHSFQQRTNKRQKGSVHDSVSEYGHTHTHTRRQAGVLRVFTAGQIKSHKNEALHMEKQHTMFASYIAPAEPSIEGEQ